MTAALGTQPAVTCFGPARGSVEIRDIGLPGYLDRKEIVRSSEDYKLDVRANAWWGEPLGSMLGALTRPFLQPIQRVMPPIANVDLSPLVLLLVLQIVLMVLAGARNGFAPLLFGG
mgnify:CR=1 FL=1